jgi:hypothetical protein
MFLLLLIACRTATVVDACASDPEWCPTCADAADCAYTGNPCTATVYCAHVDAPIAVIQIGCDPAIEYTWPAADTCGCEAGVCGSGSPPE